MHQYHALDQTARLLLLRRRVLPAGYSPATIHDEMDAKQPEQVLLDQNAIAKASGSNYLVIGSAAVKISSCSSSLLVVLKTSFKFR